MAMPGFKPDLMVSSSRKVTKVTDSLNPTIAFVNTQISYPLKERKKTINGFNVQHKPFHQSTLKLKETHL